MTVDQKKFSIRLNAFLFEIDTTSFESLLDSAGRGVKEYDLLPLLGIEGKIYVKEREEGRPRWASHLDILHGSMLPGLTTLSASAVLFVKAKKRTIAFIWLRSILIRRRPVRSGLRHQNCAQRSQ